jgi:hypothetical protein
MFDSHRIRWRVISVPVPCYGAVADCARGLNTRSRGARAGAAGPAPPPT